MVEKRDNYQIQLRQAQKHFLTYDQQELISRCDLHYDDAYFYVTLLSQPYRICRTTGNMEKLQGDNWVDGNSFSAVMTLLDWLCDSRQDRYITGRWINVVTSGPNFHSNLQENEKDADAQWFEDHTDAFIKALKALGGEEIPGADIGYAVELLDGLRIFVQFWHGDEEFYPRVRCLWDENVFSYLRYETTWYAVGLLMARIREEMEI